MRTFALAAAAVFSFSTIALAEEGGGGVVSPAPVETIQARSATHDTGQARTPVFDGQVLLFSNQTLPAQANEAIVESANSLPLGAAPASTPAADRMESARGETVAPGHLISNNGSGVSQTAASMPPGAMKGTVPQMLSDEFTQYAAAHKDGQMAALHARQAARQAASQHAGLIQ